MKCQESLKLPRRKFLHLAAGAAALQGVLRFAWSQSCVTGPVHIIVAVPPGGVADPIAPILADHLTVAFGKAVVVENVTGAGGSIGVGRAARAAPDGYTLSIGNWLSHVGASAVYPVQYDVLGDFEPVSLLTNSPMLITARKDFPANDLKELIAWLKANPDKATAATVGPGSASHVSGVYFQHATGTRFQLVPYRGGGPAVQDEVAGHVDLVFNEATGALPYVLSRQIKTYAVLAKSRWFAAPDIPTSEELGVPGINIFILARAVGSQGYAERDRRKAQHCSGRRARRRNGTQAAHRHRPGNIPTRQADPGSASCLPQGRDREVVADHQGGWHQGGIALRRRDFKEGRCETSPPQILASNSPTGRTTIRSRAISPGGFDFHFAPESGRKRAVAATSELCERRGALARFLSLLLPSISGM